VLDWVFTECLGLAYEWTGDEQAFEQTSAYRINYSHRRLPCELHIESCGLLFEEEIVEKDIVMSRWDDLPIFFQTAGGDIPFDLFSAIFYLLSRYEEYLPYEPDEYLRFPHAQSLAFREGFLNLPLVDCWVQRLGNLLLTSRAGLPVRRKAFRFVPTYDIDIAYSYRGKGFLRQIGGLVKDGVKGRWGAIAERIQVWRGVRKDPYDAFAELDRMHATYGLKPIYFFLLGQGGRLDKNLDPDSALMQRLLQETRTRYALGIHPSWRSHEDEQTLVRELRRLPGVTKSRQHYIRFTLPETYRLLLGQGITDDYSMGYGSINGFRASTSQPYYWFDVDRNEQTGLRLHPFCFMECNSFFEQGYSAAQAAEELAHYLRQVKETGGQLITIWHNFSLGSDPMWAVWREVYGEFVCEVSRTG